MDVLVCRLFLETHSCKGIFINQEDLNHHTEQSEVYISFLA